MSAGRLRITHGTPRRCACVTALVLLAGDPACAPDDIEDDGVVETAHLRITSSEDNPICAGTPLLLESELERIAKALELPLWSEDDKLDTRFGVDSVAEVCAPIFEGADEAQGCVRRVNGDLVLAAVEVANTAPHELVHAVRGHNHVKSAIVFEEGLAELLSGSDGFPFSVRYPHGDSYPGPIELLDVPRAEFHLGLYVSAASFVSWQWETYDQPTLMSFMNDPAFSDADAALPLFETHFGVPLSEAEQAWRDDPRPDPIWGNPCIPERTYSLADGPIELSGAFDCREPTVYGASHFMKLWPMCLDVPETTRVRLSLDADHGRFQVLSREPCDAGPAGAEAYRDKYLEAGDVLEEDIAGCRYRMLLFSQEPGFPATPYTIRIEEIDG
jgi:hypothetical protein